MKIEHHEVSSTEAAELIRANWARFDRARWNLFQDSEGWDVGETVDKFKVFDWTDNPRMGGVNHTNHVADWEEEEFPESKLIERVIRCIPQNKMVTVILNQ